MQLREELDKAIAQEESGLSDAHIDDDSEEFSEYLVRIGASLLCEDWNAAGAASAVHTVAVVASGFGIGAGEVQSAMTHMYGAESQAEAFLDAVAVATIQ